MALLLSSRSHIFFFFRSLRVVEFWGRCSGGGRSEKMFVGVLHPVKLFSVLQFLFCFRHG